MIGEVNYSINTLKANIIMLRLLKKKLTFSKFLESFRTYGIKINLEINKQKIIALKLENISTSMLYILQEHDILIFIFKYYLLNLHKYFLFFSRLIQATPPPPPVHHHQKTHTHWQKKCVVEKNPDKIIEMTSEMFMIVTRLYYFHYIIIRRQLEVARRDDYQHSA